MSGSAGTVLGRKAGAAAGMASLVCLSIAPAAVSLFGAALLMSQPAAAATGTWTGANNATWNSSATNWSGVSGTPWDSTNGPANDAVFNTNNINAFVSGTLYAKSIAFPQTGIVYSSGATSGISLSGTSTLSAASSRTGYIYASLYGSGTLTKSDAGDITVFNQVGFGANTFNGAVVVDAGRLFLNAGGSGASGGRALSSASSYRINSGATIAMLGNDPMGSGPITINSGTLRHETGQAYFQSVGALTLNGGTVLSAQGFGASFQGLALKGNVTVGGASASTIGTQESTNNGVQLFFNTTDPTQQRTFDVADATSSSATDLLVSAPLLNSSHTGTTAGIIKAGVGTMVLSAANLYTGTTTINAGTLQVGDGGTTGSLDAASAVTGLTGATFAYSRSDNTTFSNIVSGGLAFAKFGSGTLSLTGANTYSGTTNVNAGMVQIGSGSTTGSINSASVISGSTGGAIAFNRSDDLTFSNTISGGVGLTKNAANAVRLTGAVSYTGTTNITAGVLDFGFVSGTTTWTAPIVGSSGTFRYSGAGTLAVSGSVGGANSFTGAVVVDSGVLQMGLRDSSQSRGFSNASSFTVNSGATLAVTRDSMSNSASITLNSGTLTAGSVGGSSNMYQALGPLTMNAGTIVTGQGIGAPFNSFGLNGDVTVAGSATSQILAGVGSNNGVHLAFNAASGVSRTFTVADVTSSAAADLTVSAALLNSSHTSGTINLVKAGLGTMRLTGVNTYTGTTAVNAGTLLVDGNNSAATGAVTVASGATLGGSGTLGGAVTVDGILSPGSSPGVLTAPSILLSGSSTSIFEIDGVVRGTGYDGVTITQAGGLTFGGVLSLVFSGTFANDTTFDLFNFSGAPIGSFASVTASGPYGALTFTNNGSGVWTSGSTSVSGQTMTFTQSTGDLVIVPEPGALALAGLGITVAVAAFRRRRR